MKSLSDEMFRHFQVNIDSKIDVDSETISGSLLLSQILSEMCFDLQAAGFQANLPDIDGEFSLSISVFDMRRIFDNLFSNIKKYADPSKPVAISVSKQSSEVGVMISNHIRERSDIVSNGIGLPTVKKLVEEHGGRFDVTKADEKFCIHIFMPIINDKEITNK